MPTTQLRAWLGQVTTGAGFMLLAPTLLALAGHQVTLAAAIPPLAAGLVGLIWPENPALAAAVRQGATEAAAAAPASLATIETIVAAYRTGVQHGVASQPAAASPK